MASHMTQCGICDDEYNTEDKKPAMLPCGHSYCQECLQKVEETSCGRSCPFCRTQWSSGVHDLPICYQLMPQEKTLPATSVNVQQFGVCDSHTFLNSFFCTSCQAEACKMCIIESHKNCDLILLEDAAKPNKRKFDNAYSGLRAKIAVKQSEIKAYINDNSERISSIQTFSKTLKKFELELLNRQKELEGEDKKVVEDMEYLENRHNDDGDEPLDAVLKDRICFYKLEKPFQKPEESKLSPLCQIATTFQELDDADVTAASFIAKFCHSQQEFASSRYWTIEDEASAVGALMTIVELNQRPAIALIRSSSKKPLKSLSVMLPIFTQESNELHVELMDSFWSTKSTVSSTQLTDSLRLAPLINCGQLTKLSQFFGYLDLASLNKINVSVLGLALYQPSDITIINTVTRMNLRQLHVSVMQCVAPGTLGALQPSLYTHCRCYIHFPHMTDDKISWMMKILAKLIPLTTVNERIHSLCLPCCNMSQSGLEILLGLVHGCEISRTVWLEAPHLGVVTAKRLVKRFLSFGLELRSEGAFMQDEIY